MSDVQSKRCPRCKEVDVTDFSTCKSCGYRYDAGPLVKMDTVTSFNFWPFILILVISLAVFHKPLINAMGIAVYSGKQKTGDPGMTNFASNGNEEDEKAAAVKAELDKKQQDKERQDKLKQMFHF